MVRRNGRWSELGPERPTACPCAPPAGSVFLTLVEPVRRADLPALIASLEALLASGTAPVLVCDVDLSRVDLVTVDALARAALVAHRLGRQMRLRRAPADLCALVHLTGLNDVLRRCAGVR